MVGLRKSSTFGPGDLERRVVVSEEGKMEIRFSMGDDERYLTLAPNEIWVAAVARPHCRFNIVRKGVFATEI